MRILAARAGRHGGPAGLGAAARRLADTRATAAAAGAGGGQHQPDRAAVGRAAGALRDELADQETGAGINMDRGKGAGKSTATGAPALPDGVGPAFRGRPAPARHPRRRSQAAPRHRQHRRGPGRPVSQHSPGRACWPGVVPERRVLGLGQPGRSIGPSLSLPLFDHGRRKSVVELRKLEQQEAAVDFQRTVLKAGRRSTTRSTPTAERQQARQLAERARSAGDACKLALARYEGGRWTTPWRWTASGAICRRGATGRQRRAAGHALCHGQQGHWQCAARRGRQRAARRVAGVRPALVCCPAQAKRPSSASAVTTMQYSPSGWPATWHAPRPRRVARRSSPCARR